MSDNNNSKLVYDVILPSASDFRKPNVEIKQFPDGDSYVRIQTFDEIKNILSTLDSNQKSKFTFRIFGRLHPNQNDKLIELFFVAKTLKTLNVGNLELYAPYIPYARQDKLWKSGESLSAEYVIEFLLFSGISKITTLDCHFIKKSGDFNYWGMDINNKSASKYLIQKAENYLNNPLIMSPDAGASYMSAQFGGGHMKKVRGEYVKGNTAYREIKTLQMEGKEDINGKDVLLVDDIIGSGGTMIRAINVLKKAGARKIGIAATHGFFLNNSLQTLKELSDVIITTTSIKSEVSSIDAFDILLK